MTKKIEICEAIYENRYQVVKMSFKLVSNSSRKYYKEHLTKNQLNSLRISRYRIKNFKYLKKMGLFEKNDFKFQNLAFHKREIVIFDSILRKEMGLFRAKF